MRHMLYTPGIQYERAKKAWKYGPDAVILDLEDTIPLSNKSQASLKIVKEFERAMSRGIASISVDNQLVDYTVYKRALQVIAGGEEK